MWASLVVGLLARPGARRVAALALALLTIALFILNLRRTAERAWRTAERLETLERNDAIHRQMLVAPARCPRSHDDLLDRLLLDRLRKGGLLTSGPALASIPEKELHNQARIEQNARNLKSWAGRLNRTARLQGSPTSQPTN